MGELGDLLEALHRARQMWSTARATGRHWTRPASIRSQAEVFEWRLSVAAPERKRSELFKGRDIETTLVDGHTCLRWSKSRPRPILRTFSDPRVSNATGPWEMLLDPWPLVPALDLHIVGHDAWRGRAAIRVEGSPVSRSDPDAPVSQVPHGFGVGADTYGLLVDAETGLVVRIVATLKDEALRSLEIIEVELDADLPEELFVPPASADLPMEKSTVILELHEVAAAVPFEVFVPARPPLGYPPEALVEPDDIESGRPLVVYISYDGTLPDGPGPSRNTLWLLESAAELPEIPRISWRDADGLSIGIDRNIAPPMTRVRLVAGGTHIDITSNDLSEEQLVRYARSLVHLPEQPPRLERPS